MESYLFNTVMDFTTIVTTTTDFFNPQKRLFAGYLCTALLLALTWLCLHNKNSFAVAVNRIFSPKIWLAQSSKSDCCVFFINRLIFLFTPTLFTQLSLATFLFYSLYEFFGERPLFLTDFSDLSIGLIFTVCYFVLDDFTRFYMHRLMHRWSFLWRFHQVHHSATVLTPMTVFRIHPVEALLFSIRSILTQSLAIGVLVFFLGDRTDIVTVLGANIFTFLFNALGSNLRHSHINIHYWPFIEKLFISPAQHQIHHSTEKKHWDKNYGATLAVWDWFFGSHHHSEKNHPLLFGLNQQQDQVNHSLYFLYLEPFRQSIIDIKRSSLVTYNKIKRNSVSQYLFYSLFNLLMRYLNLKKPVESNAGAYCTESKAFFTFLKLTHRVTIGSLQKSKDSLYIQYIRPPRYDSTDFFRFKD